MPIRPENKSRYPKNWKQVRERIQKRAGDKCEWCGVPNHHWVTRLANGFRSYSIEQIADGAAASEDIDELVKIICTTAHLDHTPENCEDDNLAFLCQKCHNQYDAKHRAAGKRERKDKSSGQRKLFG